MKHKISLLVVVIIAALTLVACGGTAPATPDPSIKVIVQATLDALTAFAPQPTMTQPPTPTSGPVILPTLTSSPVILPVSTASPIPLPVSTNTVPAPSAQPLTFQPGMTFTSTTGTIQPNEVKTYSLAVIDNQPGRISIANPDSNVTISIQNPDGSELLAASQRWNNWQGYFPKQGTYLIKLYGGASTANYELDVDAFARVNFPPGATQVTLSGKTVNGWGVAYAVYAMQGQTMKVMVNTPPEQAALTIWGYTDGQPYARATAGATEFTMSLPQSQDYIVDVMPQNGQVVDYILTFLIQ